MGRLDQDGPSTTVALARAEAVRPQSMGATLAALEERGFVRRAPHPTDGRQVVFSLTDLGGRVLAESRSARQVWLAQAMAAKLDPAERQRTAQYIGAVTASSLIGLFYGRQADDGACTGWRSR